MKPPNAERPNVADMDRRAIEAELDYWERKYSGQFAPPRVIARMDDLMLALEQVPQ